MKNKYFYFCRPGGELNPAEDEVEGLKRLLTEVTYILFIIIKYNIHYIYFNYFLFLFTIIFLRSDFRQAGWCPARMDC